MHARSTHATRRAAHKLAALCCGLSRYGGSQCGQAAGGAPRVAAKTVGLHAGGIFSADVDTATGLTVLTSGKDGATVLNCVLYMTRHRGR